jgi:hypothetical protein
MRKFLFFSFVSPGVLLLRSWCSAERVRIDDNLPLFLSHFETAAVLGAFVPLLLPLVSLSFLTNFLAYRWAFRWLGSVASERAASGVCYSEFLSYLSLSSVLLGVLVFLFFLENDESTVGAIGLPIIRGLPLAVVSCVASMLQLLFICLKRRASGGQQPSKQPLLSEESELRVQQTKRSSD